MKLPDLESGPISIQQSQAVLGTGNTETMVRSTPIQVAGVLYSELMVIIPEIGYDLHDPAPNLLAYSMLDRIFHEGLEHHRGYLLIQRVLIYLVLHFQPVFETHVFKRQIILDNF